MKEDKITIVLYYSFTGTSRVQAEIIAKENGDCIVCEIKETKKRTMGTALLTGCPMARFRSASKIEPIPYKLSDFDKIILVAPVWNGYPAPAFNAMVEIVPRKKAVEIYLCSSGGETPKSKEGTCQLLTKRDCNVLGYHDIKTNKNMKDE
ncbi:MAG: hypothetical protein PUC65_17305 [Clostridiales bacterium]|nr:hypothetical protein [Clostridiales bacterium]